MSGDPYSGAWIGAGLVTLVVVGVPLGLLAMFLAYKAWRGSRTTRWIILVLAVIGLGVGCYGAVYDAFVYEYREPGVPAGYLTFAAVSAVLAVVAARALRGRDASK